MAGKTLTTAIMDAPYESLNSATALRMINAALQMGHNVNVFAYEGAVNLTKRAQTVQPNPVKGTSVEHERRRLADDDSITGMQKLKRKAIPELVDELEQVWLW